MIVDALFAKETGTFFQQLFRKIQFFPCSFDENPFLFYWFFGKFSRGFLIAFSQKPYIFFDSLAKLTFLHKSFDGNHILCTIHWRKSNLFRDAFTSFSVFPRFFQKNCVFSQIIWRNSVFFLWIFGEICIFSAILWGNSRIFCSCFWRNLCFFSDLLSKSAFLTWSFDEISCDEICIFYDPLTKLAYFLRPIDRNHVISVEFWRKLLIFSSYLMKFPFGYLHLF